MSDQPLSDKEIFNIARRLNSADAVEAYVGQICGDDLEKRDRIEALLAADKTDGFLLQSPETLLELVGTAGPGEKVGESIRQYKLLQRIGEGGMGVVYLAEQTEPISRRVALKIIKPGFDSDEVIARFEAERQAISLMDHPNIAKILDAGALETGRPYFVMELVEGVSITKYCDQNQLTIRERLELLIPVCQAVQHAHQKGIIHRDLKPSNILVAQYGDRPIPKVIDFGVAKAINQRLTERTLLTRLGQVVGTYTYMSPEQARLNDVDVDTRTDLYSLGVVLYELLTGETPLNKRQLHSLAFEEMLRIIREEDPLRPSMRLSSSKSLLLTAVNRRVEPKRLSVIMRGELDWIVMKALEKDRTRRYDTANSLADDLQRYLNNEPVEACPPSTWYQLRKTAARHKRVLASAMIVTVSLLVALAVSIWKGFEATEARERADSRYLAEKVARDAADYERRRVRKLLYLADMKLASDAFASGDASRLVSLLQRHIPSDAEEDLRNFAWYYLNSLVDVPKIWSQHLGDTVWAIEISPQGDRIAVGTRSGILHLYDTASGRLVDRVARTSEIKDVAWSLDGKRLATAHESGWISVWRADGVSSPSDPSEQDQEVDVEYGDQRRLLSFLAHEGGATTLVFTPDGRQIVSGGADQQIRIWDSESGEPQATLQGHLRTVEEIDLTRDGSRLVSASSDGSIILWSLATEEKLKTWRSPGRPDGARVVAVDISADGTAIAAGDINGNLMLADLVADRVVWGHQPDGIESVQLMSGGSEVVAGDRGGSIHIWSVEESPEGELSLSFQDRPQWNVQDGRVESLAVDSRLGRIISGCRDGSVVCWSPARTQSLWFGSNDMAVAGDGSILGGRFEILRFDAKGEQLRGAFGPRETQWKDFAVAGRSPRLVACSPDGDVAVYDIDNGSKLAQWEFKSEPSEVAITADGRWIAVRIREANRVVVLDVASTQSICDLSIEQCSCITFSHDGLRLAVGAMDDIVLYDVQTATEIARFVGHDSTVAQVQFHPSNRTFVSVAEDRMMKLWSLDSSTALRSTEASSFREINSVGFSSDGELLVTGGEDSTLQVWDSETFQPLLAIQVGNPVVQVAFSSQDQRIIAQTHVSRWRIHVFESKREPTDFASTGDALSNAVLVGLHDGGTTAPRRTVVVNDISEDGNLVMGLSGKSAFVWSPLDSQITEATAEKVDRQPVQAIDEAVRIAATDQLSALHSEYEWQVESISADRSVLVGSRWPRGVTKLLRTTLAFRQESGEIQLLGDLPVGFVGSQAHDVSADGRVVVGISETGWKGSAMIWDRSHGMRDLAAVVRQFGGSTDGWHLKAARAVSADGTCITGTGLNPAGQADVFWIRLPAEAFSGEQRHGDQPPE